MEEEVIRKGYLDQLMKYKDVNTIKVITGMRRVGKSYLLRQFKSYLESTGVAKDNISYIDMMSVSNSRYSDGMVLYSEMISKNGLGRQYILIDEVQLIGEWVRIIESLRNDMDCDLYVTGSNAHMLSSDIATLLTGRSVTITVLPLSFEEVCTLYGEKDPRAEFIRYLRHGGLPILRPGYSEEVTFQIINELKSDIILKDICNRKPGTDPIKIRKVIDYLYSEVGNPISVNKISDALGFSASTISDYLEMITDSMLFMKVERYDLKGKVILSQEPKYYCTDTGMRYSQPISSQRDFGKTLEAIVYLELVRRGYRVYVGKAEGGDGSDKHLEIDFIVMKGDSNDYYQVTQNLSDPSVYEREFRPFRKLSGRGERYVLTYDDTPVIKGPDAILMNIVDFLIEASEEGILRNYGMDSYSTLYDMLMEYIKVCSKISGTVITRQNFDELSGELQERFFDLQAFFGRPDLINDEMLQNKLPIIRNSNVRIFNAMIGCVNANIKEPLYKPIMTDEMTILTGLSHDISQYVSNRAKK